MHIHKFTASIMMTSQYWYELLIKPIHKTDDGHREEFILNLLLLGLLVLSAGAILIIIALYFLHTGVPTLGSHILPEIIVTLVLGALLTLSRKGYYRISAWTVVSLCYLISSALVIRWDLGLPQAIIM